MQSQDERGNIVQSLPVDLGNITDLAEKIKAAEKKGAVSHTIGQLPKVGSTVVIGGLKYRVDFSDFVKGKPVLKLTCKGA